MSKMPPISPTKKFCVIEDVRLIVDPLPLLVGSLLHTPAYLSNKLKIYIFHYKKDLTGFELKHLNEWLLLIHQVICFDYVKNCGRQNDSL